MANAEREQSLAAVWSNAPTAPVQLEQTLKSGDQVIHEEQVTVNKLWDAPIEVLRGYAHRSLILDAQKAFKSNLEARRKAEEDGKDAPAAITIQEAYDKLLQSFPTVQNITPSSGGAKKDPVQALKERMAGMGKAERQAMLRELGLL